MSKRKTRDDAITTEQRGNSQPTSRETCQQTAGGEIVDYLQNEFNKLSQQEQERAYRDLYGTEETIDEHDDPSFIPRKLQELDDALELITSKREAYDLAQIECPEYVYSCRLKFLRAENFDPKKAAKRTVLYWDSKVELWGAEIAYRGRIRLEDLNDDDLVALQSGGVRLLPGKDQSGRGLIWFRSMDYKYKAPENMARAVWYTVMQASDDEEIQKNGLVGVAYANGPFTLNSWDRELAKRIIKIPIKVAPVRGVGYHQCFDDIKLRCILPLVLVFAGKQVRQRCRLHIGGHLECLFELMTYGISSDVLPIGLEGDIDIERHLQWIEECRKQGL